MQPDEAQTVPPVLSSPQDRRRAAARSGSRNLGDTGLPLRRRGGNPMQEFDALPPDLRRWLAQAALPWSPASCRRIWQRARQRGEAAEQVLERLSQARGAHTGQTPPAHLSPA